jgi:hypothetical protein
MRSETSATGVPEYCGVEYTGMIVAESKNGMQMRVIDNKTAAICASSSSESVLAALKSRPGGLTSAQTWCLQSRWDLSVLRAA